MTTPVPSAISLSLRSRRLARWGFDHYLAIAPPSFVGPIAHGSQRARPSPAVATA